VAQRLFEKLRGRVTVIYLVAESAESVERIAKEVKARLGERVDVIVGLDRINAVLTSLRRINAFSMVGAILTLIISTIITASINVLVVNERRVEIGILKAIGASNSEVVKQFLSESLILSSIAGIVGYAFFIGFAP